MHHISIASLGVLALIPSIFTFSIPQPRASPSHQGTTLHPINILNYEASMGLQRRASNDLSVMDPQNKTHLVYGNTDGKAPRQLYPQLAADGH